MYKYQWQNVDLKSENAIAKLLKLVGTNKNVLEIGCASGFVSKVLKEQLNCNVTGIEIDVDASDKAKKYCKKVINADMETLNVADVLGVEKFDVIIFGDVIEHFKNPKKVLSVLHPHISHNGFILASIPNVAHLSVILELLDGNFTYRRFGLLDDTHLKFFTKKNILTLFRSANYRIEFWDRVVVKPEDTEFKTVLDAYPDSLLSFLESESEIMTYQFVIKAIPYDYNKQFKQLQDECKQTVLQELKTVIIEKDKQIKTLKTQLCSMLQSRSWRVTAPLRWVKNILSKLCRTENYK